MHVCIHIHCELNILKCIKKFDYFTSTNISLSLYNLVSYSDETLAILCAQFSG